MIEYLPKDIADGLREAHLKNLSRKSRFRVKAGEEIYPILKLWQDGFALDVRNAPRLRGLVDLYDGARHISQCLIIASSKEDGMMYYDFKRYTAASKTPARDFVADDTRPTALITGPGY